MQKFKVHFRTFSHFSDTPPTLRFSSVSTLVGLGIALKNKGKLVALGLVGDRFPMAEDVVKDLQKRFYWAQIDNPSFSINHTNREFGNEDRKKESISVQICEANQLPHSQIKSMDYTSGLELWGTPFQHLVWQELLKLKSATTYKNIAHSMGRSTAARAVGNAIRKNPVSILVPCHLVLPSSNEGVGNYYWGSKIKEALLK